MGAKINELFSKLLKILGKIAGIILKIAGAILAFLVVLVIIAQGMEAARREQAIEFEAEAAAYSDSPYDCDYGPPPERRKSWWEWLDFWREEPYFDGGTPQDCGLVRGGCCSSAHRSGRWARYRSRCGCDAY
ncbi:MAG: hypothetical protein KTR25_08010 [Myxococcales bacterium]|nr:hypothetical protein [Myxococcales bacterium]